MITAKEMAQKASRLRSLCGGHITLDGLEAGCVLRSAPGAVSQVTLWHRSEPGQRLTTPSITAMNGTSVSSAAVIETTVGPRSQPRNSSRCLPSVYRAAACVRTEKTIPNPLISHTKTLF